MLWAALALGPELAESELSELSEPELLELPESEEDEPELPDPDELEDDESLPDDEDDESLPDEEEEENELAALRFLAACLGLPAADLSSLSSGSSSLASMKAGRTCAVARRLNYQL